MVRFLVLALFISLSFLPLAGCSEESVPSNQTLFISAEEIEDFPRYPLKISTRDGRDLFFKVEVADTPEKSAKGLMFRKNMKPDHGMIFLFNNMAPRSFWMRNTYLPLDILYVGTQGKIVSIKQGKPLDESGIPSDYPAQAAIELNAGTVIRMNIGVGDVVYFPQLRY